MIDSKLAIESLERGREKNTERATDLLFHYITGAHPSLLRDSNTRQDTRAELKECVEAIVDASAFAVRRSYLGAKVPANADSTGAWASASDAVERDRDEAHREALP